MFRVMKDFTTSFRRFREGDPVFESDLDGDVLGFELRVKRGFVTDGNPGVHKGGAGPNHAQAVKKASALDSSVELDTFTPTTSTDLGPDSEAA